MATSSSGGIPAFLIAILVVGLVVVLAALFTVGLTTLTKSLSDTGKNPVQLRETSDGAIAVQLLTSNYYSVTATCGDVSRTLTTAGKRKYLPANATCDRVNVTARLPNGSTRALPGEDRAAIPLLNES